MSFASDASLARNIFFMAVVRQNFVQQMPENIWAARFFGDFWCSALEMFIEATQMYTDWSPQLRHQLVQLSLTESFFPRYKRPFVAVMNEFMIFYFYDHFYPF